MPYTDTVPTDTVPGGDDDWYGTEPEPKPTYEELEEQLAEARRRAARAEEELSQERLARLRERLNQ